MLYITNYQRNANQNYSGVPPHTNRMAVIKMPTNNKWEKREPSYTVGGDISWYSHWENSMGFLR